MSIKDITIVITSFKSEKKIRKCLRSILSGCNVINVENSDDQIYKKDIENEFKNVRCILTGKNLGYGKANNIGLKEVKTKYALILNPDTELFPKTLEKFLEVALKHPDFAIIAPSVADDKKDYEKFVSAAKSPQFDHPISLDTRVVKTVKGYAMFLNLSQFDDIGFFDENIFFFLEEIDLCMRLLKKNKKIFYSANIPIYHEGGRSHDSSINLEMEFSRNWHWMWSTFYYNKKYKGFLISFLIVLPKLSSAIIKVFIYSLILNKIKKKIYYQRLSGLINAIIGKNSWYRPKV